MRHLYDFQQAVRRAPGWTLTLLAGLAGLTVAIGTYYPFLHDFFALDDFIALYQVDRRDFASLLRDAFALPQALRFEDISAFWRPLGLLYFDAAWALFGRSPAPYHVANVLLHGLNAVLLAVLLRMLGRSAFAAASAAVVFATLPTYDIAVLWISQAYELLVATFGLASLTMFAAYVRYGRTRRLLYAGSLVTALFALMAKESAPFLLAVLFPMFVLLDGWPSLRRERRRATAELVPFALLFGAYSLFIVIQERPLGTSSYDVGTHIADNLQLYLRWMTLPIPYGWGSWVEVASQVTAMLLITGAVLAVVTRKGLMVFFAFWMLLVLLPVLPFASGAELRYTYLPSLPLAGAVGVGFDALRGRLLTAGFRWANLGVALGVLALVVFLSMRARDQQHWLRAQAVFMRELVEDVGSQCGKPLPPNVSILNSPIPDPYNLRLVAAVNVYDGSGADIQVTRIEGTSVAVVLSPDRCVLSYRGGHYRLVEPAPGGSRQ